VKIDFCRDEDIVEVMAFLGEHWAKDHILSRHRPLMDWQHRREEGYSFVVARNGEDLLGVLGFIPTSRYDESLVDRDTLWLALWKVRDDIGITGLGLRLYQHLTRNQPSSAIGTLGIHTEVEKIYRILGFETGVMAQHYLLNPRCRRFDLAIPGADVEPRPVYRGKEAVSLAPVDHQQLQGLPPDLGVQANRVPIKTPIYFAKRFLDHPSYRYRLYALRRKERALGLIAIRRVEQAGARALRVVDYLGSSEALAKTGSALHRLLEEHEAEYLDILSHGLPEECLLSAGLHRLDPDGSTVVPNYFEPFEQRNVKVRFAFKPPTGSSYVLFKADADQDRPNQVPDPADALS